MMPVKNSNKMQLRIIHSQIRDVGVVIARIASNPQRPVVQNVDRFRIK